MVLSSVLPSPWSVSCCWHCYNSCCVSRGDWLCLMPKGTWLDFSGFWVAASVSCLVAPLKQKLNCLSCLESAQPTGVRIQIRILLAWGTLEICAMPVNKNNLHIASQAAKSTKHNRQKMPFPHRRHTWLESVTFYSSAYFNTTSKFSATCIYIRSTYHILIKNEQLLYSFIQLWNNKHCN